MSIGPRLEAYLGSRLGTPVRVSGLSRKSGGASRETYLFDASWEGSDARGFVLRRDPVASLLESERSHEYRVLEAARGLGVPVPVVRWLELGREALDRPFFVMERVDGMVTPPTFPMAYPDEMRDRCAEDFVSILARIHRADWRAAGFGFLDAPAPGREPARRAVDLWRGIFEKDRIEPQPVLTRAFDWLERHLPETDVVTVVHADYRSGNYLHDAGGRITAMLDWEMAHLGDPHEDLGWAAMPYWSSGGRVCGLLPLDEFVARWEAQTGLSADRSRLRFYQVLGTAKMMTIALTGVRNLCEGRTCEPTLAIVGLLNGRLAREVLELMDLAAAGEKRP
ncbi:MAG: phosphotransferase family protein [Alphaproteobacteria bacterium]